MSANEKFEPPSGADDLGESEEIRSGRFAVVISWFFGIALIAVVATIVGYLRRWGVSFGDSRTQWSEAGGFIGGVLTPVLSFVSLMALLITIIMQREQLAIGREQLRGSQAELERSRVVQSRMADAMAAQAQQASIATRIAALGAALTVVSKRLGELRASTELERPYRMPEIDATATDEARLCDEILSLTSRRDVPVDDGVR